jgi:hypothetical protein
MNLPPQHNLPNDWLEQAELQDLVLNLEQGIPIDDAITHLEHFGIGAVYVPSTPPNAHPPQHIERQIEKLRLNLGNEIKLNCAAVWWLSSTPPPAEEAIWEHRSIE